MNGIYKLDEQRIRELATFIKRYVNDRRYSDTRLIEWVEELSLKLHDIRRANVLRARRSGKHLEDAVRNERMKEKAI
jgi:hypothetical protein